MFEPILFAGIMKKYSMSAIPQDSRIMTISGQFEAFGIISGSLSCPYQAKVIKKLETISNRIVQTTCISCFPHFFATVASMCPTAI